MALHHLDTPYRPSDLEQREGRIVRQGNENESVAINAELDLGHTKENIVLEDETGEIPKIEILDESEEEVEIA